MSEYRGKPLRTACAGLALIIASSALTGCTKAQESYTVYGSTNEESMVTEESFSSRFATMEYASEAEPESTPYGNTSEEAAAGQTGEEARKRRTILEDVSLVNNPEERRVIIVIPKGSKVDVLSEKEDGWYKIRYRGTVGYVKSGYFLEDYEAEQEERRKREEEEKKRKEEEARKRAEEAARKKEEARKKAEEEAKKKAEEEARKKAEAEAKKKAEEEAKKKAEAEAKKKAEEEAKKKAEEEARKKAKEEAKKKAEEEAKKKAEEEAKKKAEEERRRAMANGEVTRRLAETVNMRDPEDPDILYGVVPHGSTVTVLEDLGDGWYLVDYDGMEGMIKGGYFTEDDP